MEERYRIKFSFSKSNVVMIVDAENQKDAESTVKRKIKDSLDVAPENVYIEKVDKLKRKYIVCPMCQEKIYEEFIDSTVHMPDEPRFTLEAFCRSCCSSIKVEGRRNKEKHK